MQILWKENINVQVYGQGEVENVFYISINVHIYIKCQRLNF